MSAQTVDAPHDNRYEPIPLPWLYHQRYVRGRTATEIARVAGGRRLGIGAQLDALDVLVTGAAAVAAPAGLDPRARAQVYLSSRDWLALQREVLQRSVLQIAAGLGCNWRLVAWWQRQHDVVDPWLWPPADGSVRAAVTVVPRQRRERAPLTAQQQAAASAASVDRAQRALAAGAAGALPVKQRAALTARVEHPDWSLAQLGELFGVSASTYTHLLSRAYAATATPATPPTGRRTPRAVRRNQVESISSATVLAAAVALDADAASPAAAPLLTDRERAALRVRVQYPRRRIVELAPLVGETVIGYRHLLRRGTAAPSLPPRPRAAGVRGRLQAALDADEAAGGQLLDDLLRRTLTLRLANPRWSLKQVGAEIGRSGRSVEALQRRAMAATESTHAAGAATTMPGSMA